MWPGCNLKKKFQPNMTILYVKEGFRMVFRKNLSDEIVPMVSHCAWGGGPQALGGRPYEGCWGGALAWGEKRPCEDWEVPWVAAGRGLQGGVPMRHQKGNTGGQSWGLQGEVPKRRQMDSTGEMSWLTLSSGSHWVSRWSGRAQTAGSWRMTQASGVWWVSCS